MMVVGGRQLVRLCVLGKDDQTLVLSQKPQREAHMCTNRQTSRCVYLY